jgi:hypothetical protein
VRDRKKDFSGIFHELYFKDDIGESMGTLMNSQAAMAYTNFASSKDFSADNIRKEKMKREGNLGGGVGSSGGMYYKDVALIRYSDEAV